MAPKRFTLTEPDGELRDLITRTDKRTLAVWGIECARRVMPYFAAAAPRDPRPATALATLAEWLATGVFSMHVIRKASLDAHAAARDIGTDSPARSAAHAAGQAVAIAHVATHAYGPAIYAQQAVFRAALAGDGWDAVRRERDWQYTRLMRLRQTGSVVTVSRTGPGR